MRQHRQCDSQYEMRHDPQQAVGQERTRAVAIDRVYGLGYDEAGQREEHEHRHVAECKGGEGHCQCSRRQICAEMLSHDERGQEEPKCAEVAVLVDAVGTATSQLSPNFIDHLVSIPTPNGHRR